MGAHHAAGTSKWPVPFDEAYVREHIHVPNDATRMARILGWSGPARSGTTALLLALAGHAEISRLLFQPQRSLMRIGRPEVVLPGEETTTIAMKETFWSMEMMDSFDPVANLLGRGVPPAKLRWIFLLRDPAKTYASWIALEPSIPPEVFAHWQHHTVQLHQKYSEDGIEVLGLTYESFHHNEAQLLEKICGFAGLARSPLPLRFDTDEIARKVAWGQAEDEHYFAKLVQPALRRQEFGYVHGDDHPDPAVRQEIRALCQEEYEVFHRSSLATLAAMS